MAEVDADGRGIDEVNNGAFACAVLFIDKVLECRLLTKSIPIELDARELEEPVVAAIKFSAKIGGGVVCFFGTVVTGVGVKTEVL